MAVPPLVVAALVAAMALPATARAADDDDGPRTIAVGDSVTGKFSDRTPTYIFHGERGTIVTITLAGKTAEQIGVVMVRSDKDFDFEWITGHYDDDFKASGNVRDGDTLRLTLRLPRTAKYHVFIRDAHFNEEQAPYELSISDGGGGGRAYVRGTLGLGPGTAGDGATLGANATLGIGQRRGRMLGVEAVLGGSVLRADGASLMGFLGVGLRVARQRDPINVRFAVGVSGMVGIVDHLGGGVRFDFHSRRYGWGVEAARLGRTNVALGLINLAF